MAIAYLRAMFDGSVDALVALDANGSPVMWNERYLNLWGLNDDILENGVSEDRLKIMSGRSRDPEFFYSRHRDIMTKPAEEIRFEVTLNSGNVLEGSASPVSDVDGTRIGQLLTFRDVTEHRNAEEQRNFLAQHDPVTGFFNRAALFERIERLIDGTKSNVHLSCGVISLDLPCFAAIVEEHGYRFGDRLLAAIADRLDASVNKEAHIARHADAEFIIHSANTSETDLRTLATQALESLTAPIRIDDVTYELVAHAGISMLPRDGETVDDLVGKAALARRQATSSGEDFVFFSEQFGREAAERVAFERDLTRAIERDEFFLVYQPFFDLHTVAVVACEALLRWNRGGTEVIPPMEFIPLAEHTGLIVEIGEWVLRRACEQTRKWQTENGAPIPVSVNISALQLEEPDFDQTVARILQETDLPPHLLQLELTETMRIQDAAHAADLIERILDL